MNRPHKLLYVMNIPSPYRWHLFNRMHQIGHDRGIYFEVAFLSKQSLNRRWKIDEFPQSFRFSVPWGVNLSQTSDRLLNPGLVFRLLYQRWDWVILGGYDNPSTALLALLPLLNTRVTLIRNEGNLQAHSRYMHGFIAKGKQFVLNRCDGYLVPGQRGRAWLQYWVPELGDKPVHEFPNVIDDKSLVAQIEELRKNRNFIRQELGVNCDKRLFITPARLSPEKGIIELIQNLPANFGRTNTWLIAGEGPLKPQIERILMEKQLTQSIKLLGYVDASQMPKLYAAADIFLLPSLSDPNPLSSIEAAFAGLPLLISRRIGNEPELLINDVTGWSFDPSSQDETLEAVHNAIVASRAQLMAMSTEVRRRAQELFACDTACERLFDFLLNIHPTARISKFNKGLSRNEHS